MKTSYDIKIGFYYTDLIYSGGTIVLYYNSNNECFQFLYTKYNVGNFLYVLTPIIFVMDEHKNILASRPIIKFFDKNLELYSGIRVFIQTNEGDISIFTNDEPLRISKAETLIVKQTFLINAIKNLPSLYDFTIGMDNEIARLKQYMSSIDFEAILSSLEVSISESFISKVGGDDRYAVYRTTKTFLPNIDQDSYLIRLLGLGRNHIYEDSGYTSAYSMALPNLKTGVLAGEDYREYLLSLRNNYSVVDHAAFLLKEWCEKYVSRYANQRSFYEEQLSETEKIFEQTFLIKFYKTGHLDTYGVKFVGLENKQPLFEADTRIQSYERMIGVVNQINETIFKYVKAISSARSGFVKTIIDLQ